MLICGRYEGVDERVATHLATDEISIGDYVLSGGGLRAAVLMETVARLLPGVLGNEESKQSDPSPRRTKAAGDLDGAGLLDFPQYTRPAEFRGLKTPEVLLSGNHRDIRASPPPSLAENQPDAAGFDRESGIGCGGVSRAAFQEAALEEAGTTTKAPGAETRATNCLYTAT